MAERVFPRHVTPMRSSNMVHWQILRQSQETRVLVGWPQISEQGSLIFNLLLGVNLTCVLQPNGASPKPSTPANNLAGDKPRSVGPPPSGPSSHPQGDRRTTQLASSTPSAPRARLTGTPPQSDKPASGVPTLAKFALERYGPAKRHHWSTQTLFIAYHDPR